MPGRGIFYCSNLSSNVCFQLCSHVLGTKLVVFSSLISVSISSNFSDLNTIGTRTTKTDIPLHRDKYIGIRCIFHYYIHNFPYIFLLISCIVPMCCAYTQKNYTRAHTHMRHFFLFFIIIK